MDKFNKETKKVNNFILEKINYDFQNMEHPPEDKIFYVSADVLRKILQIRLPGLIKKHRLRNVNASITQLSQIIYFEEIKEYFFNKLLNECGKLKDFCNLAPEVKFIAVIGAGISFEAEIKTGIEAEVIRRTLKIKENFEDFHKEFLRNKKRYYNEIITKGKKEDFKKEFIKEIVIKRKKPSCAHTFFAEIFCEDLVMNTILFNWDDLIEIEIKKKGGSPKIIVGNEQLDKNGKKIIWKPNGDVNKKEYEWYLPGEGKRLIDINQEVIKRIAEQGCPYIVTIGYSGSDLQLTAELCEEIAFKPTIYDIDPKMEKENIYKDLKVVKVNLSASEALLAIKSWAVDLKAIDLRVA